MRPEFDSKFKDKRKTEYWESMVPWISDSHLVNEWQKRTRWHRTKILLSTDGYDKMVHAPRIELEMDYVYTPLIREPKGSEIRNIKKEKQKLRKIRDQQREIRDLQRNY